MAASAISATLSFNTSVPCKKQHRLGASIFSPQQFSGSNAHWHPSANLKSRTPLPKLRAANRVVVAQAGTYKVAILGAGGGIGQALSLLVKMSPLVSTLHLYDDTADAKGVAADLSHCNTPAQVAGFTGRDELAGSVSGADVVVFLADATPDDDSFAANAGVIKDLAEAVADHAPGALVHVVAGPVDSTVPVAAEVLKRKGAYDPRKLFGVTTLDVVRANTFVAARKGLPLADVDVPVVGGHAGDAALPLLSKARPRAAFTDEEAEELTSRVRNAAAEVAEADGEGPPTLSVAYAAARFVEASLRGLDGDGGVYECAYVQSQLVPELPFFACRVKLGRDGVEEVVGSELRGLSDYEARALDALKPQLRASIDRGVAYVQQQPATASLN
jgi:malate dehydrogenase